MKHFGPTMHPLKDCKPVTSIIIIDGNEDQNYNFSNKQLIVSAQACVIQFDISVIDNEMMHEIKEKMKVLNVSMISDVTCQFELVFNLKRAYLRNMCAKRH